MRVCDSADAPQQNEVSVVQCEPLDAGIVRRARPTCALELCAASGWVVRRS